MNTADEIALLVAELSSSVAWLGSSEGCSLSDAPDALAEAHIAAAVVQARSLGLIAMMLYEDRYPSDGGDPSPVGTSHPAPPGNT